MNQLFTTPFGVPVLSYEDDFCPDCREPWRECLYSSLPAYQGADMTLYRTKEHSNGNRR